MLVCLIPESARAILTTSQLRIDHGVLIRWTKGFGAPNIEGEDVATMFASSLDRLVSYSSAFSSAPLTSERQL